jgi:predicted nucleic acid-binding protein
MAGVERVFVDTNILLYAFDRDAGVKHAAAKNRLSELAASSTVPCLSVQVLQEFAFNLKKRRVSAAIIREMVEDLSHWTVVDNTATLLLSGLHLAERWKISFWDSLILAAAVEADADVLWSEDFNTGQRYESLRVVNPLLPR